MTKIYDDLYVNFKSLEDNQDWQAINSIYLKNIDSFSILIEQISKIYKTTRVEARDMVLYELMSSFYGSSHKNMLFSKQRLRWVLLTLLILFGIFLNSLASVFIIKKKIRRDLIFEEMFAKSGWSIRFYKYIVEHSIKKLMKQTVLYIHPGFNNNLLSTKIEGWTGEVLNRRASSLFFSFKDSWFVLLTTLLLIPKLLSCSKQINMFYLYLRFIRKYLVYSSQIKNIEAKVLVAAGDYYWNPIKYFVYKKNIKNVILLQHNFKNEYLFNRVFQYCDYYYAHSHNALEKLEGMPYAEKHAIGSFQLIPFLDKQKNVEYDIMFINQTVNDDLTKAYPSLDQQKLVDSYFLLINHFKCFLESHPTMKAVYVAKGETIESEPSISVRKIFEDIPNIEFEGTYGARTFELVKKSTLIINMYSSVGFEAYGFDKKVLWINYSGCCDIFKYDMEEESLHVLRDSVDYNAFEERVELLLSDNDKINRHYKALKEKYMNIQENPAIVVANKIDELVQA